MNKFFQKTFLSLILVSLFLPISGFLKTNRAQALTEGGGTAGAGTAVAGKLLDKAAPQVVTDPKHTTGTVLGWAWNQKDVVGKWALKTAGTALKKVLLDRLVDATVAWINRGGEGAIIENWDQFLDKAGNDAAGIAFQSLGAGFLCSPFSAHVQLSLLPVEPFSQITCSLDQIIGNVEAFENDFRNGSWIAYQQTWMPKNNFYGAVLMAMDEKTRAVARARENAQNQAIAGKGFLSFEKDEYIEDPNGLYIDKKGTLFNRMSAYAGPRYSRIKRTLTPGSFVGDAVTQSVIATPINALIGADDTAKYITAIVNAGVNKLTTLGIDGLRGIFAKKNSDFTSVTSTAPCSGLTGEAFRACLNYNTVERNVYQNDRYTALSQINDALKPRKDAALILAQLLTKQSELVNALTSLAACKPGDALIGNELDQEQGILDDLKDQFTSNQTYLGPLEQAADSINKATSTDWSALTVQSNGIQPISDLGSANDFLTNVQAGAEDISANVNTKLPGIQTQLTGCSPQLIPVTNNL